MSEVPEVNPLKGTVAFTRSISDGNYGKSEFFMSVQYDIPQGAEAPVIIDAARAAALIAKSVTFEQLGIKDEIIDGVVVELARQAFPGSVIEPSTGAATSAAPQAAAPAGQAGTVAATPPFAGDTKDADEKKANKAWATDRYATHPGDFYDNRPKKEAGEYSAKSPDVKHKTSGIGLWF
jgi:hypothetical protein